jgi:hypothetical protein
MNSNLYIPKKIKVGYQTREGTYSGKLGYIICYGVNGKLRKESSWEGWRDKKIEPNEYDNEPLEGFIINKNVERYNWSHFSSNRSYIRIYDPRGIEFEVTPENLTGILTVSDVNKRALSGKFIYAWHGKDLVLLPCVSEEYEKAQDFTYRQHQKIFSKDLTPGCSYKTKKNEDVVYVGYYYWYQLNLYGKKASNKREGKKYHIFYSNVEGNGSFYPKSNLEFLSIKNSDEITNDFASIIEKFQNNIHSSKIIEWRIIPTSISLEKYDPYNGKYGGNYNRFTKSHYFKISGNIVTEYSLGESERHDDRNNKREKGYTLSVYDRFNLVTESYLERESHYDFHWPYYVRQGKLYSKEEIETMTGYGDLEVTLENGKKFLVNSLYSVLS